MGKVVIIKLVKEVNIYKIFNPEEVDQIYFVLSKKEPVENKNQVVYFFIVQDVCGKQDSIDQKRVVFNIEVNIIEN